MGLDLVLLIRQSPTILIGLVLLPVAWLSAREWAMYFVLRAQGQHTQGQVVSKTAHVRRRSFITYRFEASDAQHQPVDYTRKQETSSQHAHRKQPKDVVEVLYLASKPDISMLSGQDTDNTVRDTYSLVAVRGLLLSLALPVHIIVWAIAFLVYRFNPKFLA